MHWALVAVAKGERDLVNIAKAVRPVLTLDEINVILRSSVAIILVSGMSSAETMVAGLNVGGR